MTEPQPQLEQVDVQEAEQIREHGAVAEDYVPSLDVPTMKVDLHCHSEASSDCITPLADIPKQCRQAGIRVQAITDHNEIWGAKKLKALVEADPDDDLQVIVGEEISTNQGEIIGLFLEEKIEPGLSPEETVRQIREQGGLVLLPHGFDPLKRYRLRPDALTQIAGQIDIVETFNARISRPRWNRAAVDYCEERKLLMSAGSDAHRLADIGAAWVEVPKQPVNSPADLLRALENGVPTGNWTHPVLAFLAKMWNNATSRVRSR
jgi:predicted metal-dependent phosphoesterase TrpH